MVWGLKSIRFASLLIVELYNSMPSPSRCRKVAPERAVEPHERRDNAEARAFGYTQRMTKWLDGAAAVTALAAAVFWFLSAAGKAVPLVPAANRSAKMNRWAAAFSGISALCMSASQFIGK